MNYYISMLRGINVGGKKKIRMVELRALYESLGFANVQSYLQSGNVVFGSSEQDMSMLETIIASQIEQAFGYNVSVFVRNQGDFHQILHNNPFLKGQEAEPTKLYVTFLAEIPAKSKLLEMARPKDEADKFAVVGKEIFLVCPGGYGRTKLSNNFFERKLSMAATTRNWKTVNRLYQMVSASDGS